MIESLAGGPWVKPTVQDERVSISSVNATRHSISANRRTITVGPVVDDHNRRVLRCILGWTSELGAVHVVRGHTRREPSDATVAYRQNISPQGVRTGNSRVVVESSGRVSGERHDAVVVTLVGWVGRVKVLIVR
jgi:hypothetical protein